MDVVIDKVVIKDASRVIHSDDFAQFLLSHTTEFAAAAWILQSLFDAENGAIMLLDEDI